MDEPKERLKDAAGKVGLTHLALRCGDTTATAKFYESVCGMSIVHERAGDGMPVYWVSARPLGLDFVLVLLSGGKFGDAPRMDHLGFTVASRADVDRIAAIGRELGILQYEPTDSGPPVGYWTMIRDPDGNWVEFSVDQDIAF
ncbi:MAG: VOC family protein [Planctomycetes bacterium]|nr:VOC family protein [Planctomycetota bacterium]